MFRIWVAILFCSFTLVRSQSPAVKMKTTSASGAPMVTIPGTEVRTIASTFTNASYDLYVFLPAGYSPGHEKYPVLYWPDAFYTFGAVSDLVRNLQGARQVRPFLVVGISEGIGWDSPETKRQHDFTEGAGAYLQFIRKELIPFVEATYDADPAQRAFHGGSLGGLFGTYVLLTAPDTFSAYLLASPAFRSARDWILTREARYASSSEELPAKVFMTMGKEEAWLLPAFHDVTNRLRTRNYRSFQLTVIEAEGQIHETADMVTLPAVLRQLYAPGQRNN